MSRFSAMPLATRLLWFFLAALALVLVGFSATLYGLAHVHMHRQAHDRLDAALNVLRAAADVDSDGVEFDLHERGVNLSSDGASAVWRVTDERGQRIDGSGDSDNDSIFDITITDRSVQQRANWLISEELVLAPTAPSQLGPKKHKFVTIHAAVSLKPVQRTLNALAGVLIGLGLGIWTAAALAGRWLCGRALAPLTRMAEIARGITADHLGQRLPNPGTNDELDNLGGAFNDLLARLEESFERQRQFTGNASHQLRTPLAGTLGQVEVALRRERTPEEYRRVLESVRGQAGEMRQIVEALLFLARADAEAQSPALQSVDLSAWVPQRLKPWDAHPRAADIQFDTLAGPMIARIHPALLGQVLDNLLDNACKYSEPNTPIAVTVSREPDGIYLTVADRGCGILPNDEPHLFEPFFRSAESRRRGVAGTGLGLAVVARIVAAIGGRIAVASEPGKGSRFTICLPIVPPASPSAIPPQPAIAIE